MHPITQILLVDDSPGDVRLTREAFRSADFPSTLHVAADGVEALAFLRRKNGYAAAPRPDLILLDLNMPRKDGWEVLAEIKADADLKTIPVVIMTTSDAEHHARACYEAQCNCYVTKPVILSDFLRLIRNVGRFWIETARLPMPQWECGA